LKWTRSGWCRSPEHPSPGRWKSTCPERGNIKLNNFGGDLYLEKRAKVNAAIQAQIQGT